MKRQLIVLLLPGFAVLSFLACKDDADEQLRNRFHDTMTSFYAGDVDALMQFQDYGQELDSVHMDIQRLMLQRHLDEVREIGGVESIDSISVSHENDSIVFVDYIVFYGNGSRETHIVKMRKFDEEWKICIKG